MILQGTTTNDTAALIEALTNAEAEKQRFESELVETKADLDETKTDLADADAALDELGVVFDG